MLHNTALHRSHLLTMLFGAGIAALLFALSPAPTFAILRGCRTDPIVRLSNGDVLQLTASIDTSVTSIESVTYTIHAPVGTRITNIVYTNGPVGPKERVLFYADQRPNRYTTTTYVAAGSGIRVTANTMRVAPQLRDRYRGSVSGLTHQALSLSF
jgi:hypothetical protein